ncbi:hypothetical protein DPMN_012235 [Dreissena polymorpha]|uniref:G-protein coupled receptors family 1 profile domain-containing protein n=1 Tax=Dreissena polymorpha TaxID=45954 RepID=A0A9D4N6K8_DREPO|nr:hypothetical protein DPMN_012235 [Dreissena polymorpha]
MCPSFLVVAFIRWKVCECRGNASVLFTVGYFIRIFMCCFVPVVVFVVTTFIVFENDDDGQLLSNTSHESSWVPSANGRGIEGMVFFALSNMVILNIIPLVIGTVFYVKIVQIVVQSTQRIERAIGHQRHTDPARVITKSVRTLMLVTSVSWGVYIIVKTVSMFLCVDNKFFLYWKTIVYLAHPFGEGVIQKYAKNQVGPEQVSTVKSQCGGPTDARLPTDCSDASIFLPAVIEETKSTVRISKIESKKTIIRNTVRMSSNCVRPSVLMRNAPFIGLETRDEHTIPNMHRSRKQSTETLKRKLRDIHEATDETSHNSPMRSPGGNFLNNEHLYEEDEIYEEYRKMYTRRTSQMNGDSCVNPFPLANSISSKLSNVCKERDRSTCDDTLQSESPSKSSSELWRELFNDAKTKRRLATILGESKTNQSNVEPPLESQARPASGIPDPTMRSMDGPSPMTVLPEWVYHGRRRGSNSTVRKKPAITKKRSVSCVNNIWLEKNQGLVDPGATGRPTFPLGVPAKKMCSTDKGGGKLQLSRRSIPSQDGAPQSSSMLRRQSMAIINDNKTKQKKNSMHWLLNTDTTRNECIQKLVEMKNCF